MDFAVGHPRSGTHLLSDLLNAGGAAWAEHEGLVNRSPGEALIEVATAYYEGTVGADRVDEVLAACPLWRMNPIDANWKLAWILPVLLARHPDARFLHIARDPRRNVIACHNLDYYGQVVSTGEHSEWDRWRKAMPAVRRDDWASLSPFEKNCAFWAETHTLILDTLALRPGRYALVRLEDLGSPRRAKGAEPPPLAPAVAEVFRFFDLPLPPEEHIRHVLGTTSNEKGWLKGFIAEHKRDMLPAFEDCPAEIQDALVRICGPVAARLGYDLGSRAEGASAEDPVQALRKAREQLFEAKREATRAKTQLDAMRGEIDLLRDQAEQMHGSLSWRLTRPLRWGRRAAERMVQRVTRPARTRGG